MYESNRMSVCLYVAINLAKHTFDVILLLNVFNLTCSWAEILYNYVPEHEDNEQLLCVREALIEMLRINEI